MINIVQPNAPLVDKDGRITRDWYLFLLELFNISGAGSSSVINQNLFQTYTFQQNGTNDSQLQNDSADAQAVLNATRHQPAQPTEQKVSELEMVVRGANRAPDVKRLSDRIAELELLVRGASRSQEVQRLTQRVADLEARLQAVRAPVADQRTAEAVPYIFARR